MNVFNSIEENDIKKLMLCLDAKKVLVKKDHIVINNLASINTLGIILSGKAIILRIDYNGNKSVIESLGNNDIFESRMFDFNNSELSLIAVEDCEVILINYDRVINRCKKNCPYHNLFIDNILSIIISKLNKTYERIQLLTKKTIREKLLEYFKLTSENKNSRSFKLNITYSDLANYLSVDRSALMREMKKLKEDKIIDVNGKKITLIY